MSPAVVAEGTNLFFALLLVLPIICLIFKHFKTSPFRSPVPLPPGPSPWPILGNVLQMGKKPHINLANFAKTYGPLISLRLGTQSLVVGSSPAAATEILKTYDRILSGRYLPHVLPFKGSELNTRTLGWAPECNEGWKYLRTICRTELFSGKAIESQACLRERKVMDMVKAIGAMEGNVVNIGEVVFATVFNTLSSILMSKDFISLENEDVDGGMKRLIRTTMEVVSTPNISDLYPILGGLDIQGLRRKSAELAVKINAMWASTIRERRERKESHIPRERDFLDVLIENDFTNDQMNQLFMV